MTVLHRYVPLVEVPFEEESVVPHVREEVHEVYFDVAECLPEVPMVVVVPLREPRSPRPSSWFGRVGSKGSPSRVRNGIARPTWDGKVGGCRGSKNETHGHTHS